MKQTRKLINKETRQEILCHLEIANSFWSRLCGLMFRRKLPDQFGIWIVPCKSIHTMWMRIPIDVFFIDQDSRVIGIKENVRPWRIATAPKGTKSVLETRAGSVNLEIGTIVESLES